MSRIDYDDAYANAAYIPNADDFITRWQTDASAFRSDMLEQQRAELDTAYGQSKRQTYDVFHPEGEAKGTYWRRFESLCMADIGGGLINPIGHIFRMVH